MPKIKQMREQRGLTILLHNFDCSVLDLFSEEELPVATSKMPVATHGKAKGRVTNYNFCVRVNRADFPLLTKNTLSECGYKTLRAFVEEAYKLLQKRWQKIKEE